MSWRSLAALLLVLPLSACFDKGDDDDDDDDCSDSGDSGGDCSGGEADGDTDVDGDTDTDGSPSVSVSWGGSAVTVDISGGPGAWWFGIAQTDLCSGDECWTGEDCVYGFELGSGNLLSWCHDAGDSGTSLTYGGNPSDLGAGETVFPDSSWEEYVTYFLESDPDFGGDGSCYIWGDDPGYYAGLGCAQL